ncbi:MAG: hemagglutinin, partial [Methylococcaceae bacterium]
ANLNLSASQIYPSTLTHFTFALKNNPDGQITVSGNSHSDASPLSAAGQLNFEAPVINQNGVVKAPFGSINLSAGSRLTLGENSLTSVSGAGQLIPFGVIQGGFDWLYPLDTNHNLVFKTPPEKELVLSAPSVELAKGSVVDLSGGGDLLAYEFLPGSGGSYDYLDRNSQSYQGGFAVVPSLASDIAPYDPLQSVGFDYAVGSKIYLSGTAGLPAGEYTILPARYALLPGAYLVTPQADTQDLIATTYTKAGLPIVAGYQTLAGTDTRDPRWSGFMIESGADIRKHSEYDEQTANAFYAAQALKNETVTPILPMDSGRISIAAQDKLALQGEFKVASSGNRGARMDIAANRLKIVKSLSATPTAGILEVLADDLSNLGVDSLFLGGGRSTN